MVTLPDYIAGLDLGPPGEFTAFAVVERTFRVDISHYAVRHLERFAPGTAYEAVASRLTAAFSVPALNAGLLAVDQTAVGRPVVALLRATETGADIRPLTVTAGHQAGTDDRGDWLVPKKELVSLLQVLLQTKQPQCPWPPSLWNRPRLPDSIDSGPAATVGLAAAASIGDARRYLMRQDDDRAPPFCRVLQCSCSPGGRRCPSKRGKMSCGSSARSSAGRSRRFRVTRGWRMTTTEKPRGPMRSEVPGLDAEALSLPHPGKIRAVHYEKLAIVYVRQSSPQQVLEHRESAARQYALVDSAVALGWPRERVLVIDEDQGQSGRSAAGRLGFQRLLSEVTMDHVGLILGLEMSRLARSDRDWHHLLELCGVFGTLLADQEGVYDAADPNDRLLLGLKGAMSSLELQTMRNRLDKGKLSKARRGELFCKVPVGYVRLPGGRVDFDPDEQARAVVRLLFDKFEELGTVYALMRYLFGNNITLPFRLHGGARAGELDWRTPSTSVLASILHHPMYAGAYSYGRRPTDARRHYAAGKRGGGARVPIDQWKVLIRDRLPAYISWERFLGNLERMKNNRSSSHTPGAPRAGCALLCGLAVCGRCGWRMQTSYSSRSRPHYSCRRHWVERYAPCRCSVSADGLDDLVSRQVLRALEPAALALSHKAQGDVGRERERLGRHWQQTLQRARYEVEAAERRYRAADPENRLVVATLERQWEEALRNERAAHEDHDRFRGQGPPEPGPDQEARIAALAADIPALWRSAATTNRDRREIIRCLVERVVIQAEPANEHTEATIHWAGGHVTLVEFVRPVRSYADLRDAKRLKQRIVELRDAGQAATSIADTLNTEGFLPIKPGQRFTADVVRGLFRMLGIHGEIADDALLGPQEWWIHDLAAAAKVRRELLRVWATRGWVHARQTNVQRLWIIWADRNEVRRLRQLQSTVYRGRNTFPAELTTPKSRTPDH